MPSHDHEASTTIDGEHDHSIDGHTSISGGAHKYISTANSTTLMNTVQTSSNGNHSHTVTINNTGSNQPHNNMQPYIAVYMWKRTA